MERSSIREKREPCGFWIALSDRCQGDNHRVQQPDLFGGTRVSRLVLNLFQAKIPDRFGKRVRAWKVLHYGDRRGAPRQWAVGALADLKREHVSPTLLLPFFSRGTGRKNAYKNSEFSVLLSCFRCEKGSRKVKVAGKFAKARDQGCVVCYRVPAARTILKRQDCWNRYCARTEADLEESSKHSGLERNAAMSVESQFLR